MGSLWQDFRYSLRVLAKSPGFTVVAVLTLALGIGANTAIFSVANAVLIRALPYRDPGRLVIVWEDSSAYGFPEDTPAPGNFSDWKARNRVFEDMAAIRDAGFNLTGAGNPEQIAGVEVTANFFSVLGVQPALGRLFRADDDRPGAPRVVLLSHGLWVRRFGGDARAVGTQIVLDGEKSTVVGVMSSGFQFPDRESEMWAPTRFSSEELANHGSHYLRVVARLKPGVTLDQANSDLAGIARGLAEQFPTSNAKVGAFAVPLHEHFIGQIRFALRMLLGAVAFVLLIACANVANLLLARATGRKQELAVRMALGAGRARIVRQLLTESVVVATLAGGLGLFVSLWGSSFLRQLIPSEIPPPQGAGLDLRVLGFTLLLSLTTGLLFGSAPAWRITKFNLNDTLKAGGRGGIGRGRGRAREVLVGAQVALALVLLTGAGLLLQSLARLRGIDVGFHAEHVLTMETPLPEPKYADFRKRAGFYDAVLLRVSRVPGVLAAGFTTWVPLTNRGGATMITVEGRPEPRPGELAIPNTRVVSQDYFRAMVIPLKEGRMFDSRDGAQTAPVALINQTMARRLWPDEDPVGRRFKLGRYSSNIPWVTIVGVVGDVHQAGIDVAARWEMYFPYQQQDFFAPSYLAVKTAGDPMRLAETIRQEIWAVDKDQPVANVRRMETLVNEELSPRMIQTGLLEGFAGLALVLASLGIYALLSFTVAQRTQEIGLRVALGAQRRDVLHLVLAQGLRPIVTGLVVGVAGAYALHGVLGHLLYEVSATDPATFAAVAALLAAIGAAACWIPARRATRVDPMVALRYE